MKLSSRAVVFCRWFIGATFFLFVLLTNGISRAADSQPNPQIDPQENEQIAPVPNALENPGDIDTKTEPSNGENVVHGEDARGRADDPNSEGAGTPANSGATASNSNTELWYVNQNNVPKGPYSMTQIQQQIAAGEILRKTSVSKAGSQSWVAAKTVFTFPDEQWYVSINGGKRGPFNYSQMELMANKGSILPTTQIFKEGTSKWVVASSVFEFPPSAYRRQRQSAMASSRLHHGSPQNRMGQRVSQEYLRERASSVLAGNFMAGVGILGTAVGTGVQISGVSAEDETRYNVGVGLGVGFGTLRLAGVLVSGIAATKYANRSRGKSFGWGLFAGGLVMGVTGALISTLLAESDEPNLEAIIGATVAGQVLMNAFWIGHCIRAADVTESHRKHSSAGHKPYYAVHPTLDPVAKNVGFAFTVAY